MMTKVFAKKLFGVRYEKLVRYLLISIVLFGGVFLSGIHMNIAPFFICLMSVMITAGEMWHALSADDNVANMKQLFMMPMDGKKFISSYVVVLGGYVFLSRTLMILGAVFALTRVGGEAVENAEAVSEVITKSAADGLYIAGIDMRMVAMSILCVAGATLIAMGISVWKKFRVPAIIWLVGIIAACRIFTDSFIIWIVLGASIVLAGILLINTDVYAFYREESTKKNIIKGGRHHSVWVYIFRYMVSHKNYIVNGLISWGVALLLPMFFKTLLTESPAMYSFAVPIGFAILSLNTPICILLSSDPELERAVRFLPGQRNAFFVPYGLFLFVCYAIAYAIYLVSLQLQIGGVTVVLIVTAFLFAVISAVLSVLMECYFPIRGWKVVNELWNHPRKYIVPVAMLVLAGIVGLVLY